MASSDESLTDSITNLAELISNLRDEVAAEKETRAKEAKAHQAMVASNNKRASRLTAAVVISILVAFGSLFVGYRAKSTADDLVANRTQSRINTCVAFNDFAVKHNNLVDQNIAERQAIIDETKQNTTIPQEEIDKSVAFFEARIAEYQQQKVTLRDCSPEAVNVFYAP